MQEQNSKGIRKFLAGISYSGSMYAWGACGLGSIPSIPTLHKLSVSELPELYI